MQYTTGEEIELGDIVKLIIPGHPNTIQGPVTEIHSGGTFSADLAEINNHHARGTPFVHHGLLPGHVRFVSRG